MRYSTNWQWGRLPLQSITRETGLQHASENHAFLQQELFEHATVDSDMTCTEFRQYCTMISRTTRNWCISTNKRGVRVPNLPLYNCCLTEFSCRSRSNLPIQPGAGIRQIKRCPTCGPSSGSARRFIQKYNSPTPITFSYHCVFSHGEMGMIGNVLLFVTDWHDRSTIAVLRNNYLCVFLPLQVTYTACTA